MVVVVRRRRRSSLAQSQNQLTASSASNGACRNAQRRSSGESQEARMSSIGTLSGLGPLARVLPSALKKKTREKVMASP